MAKSSPQRSTDLRAEFADLGVPKKRSLLANDKTSGLNDLVFREIKSAIITCEIEPGCELSENLLAQRYRVGKAPIRHALSRLGQEGWVHGVARRGHFVSQLTVKDAQEIFEMRELLEPDVARRAVGRIEISTLKKLHDACSIVVREADAPAARRLLVAHQRFHVELAYAAGNQRIARSIEQLHHQCFRLLYLIIRSQGYVPKWDRGQQMVVDAIVAGRGDHAAKITLEGISQKRKQIVELLSRNPLVLGSNSSNPQGPRIDAK